MRAGCGDVAADPRQRRAPRIGLAALGLALGIAGVVGYFVVAIRFGAWLPGLRNEPVANWVLVAAGLVVSGLAVARTSGGRRLGVGVLAGLNVALAAAFAWFLYGIAAVPGAQGPPVGMPAPDFALADQGGHVVRLADFRGRPLLLVFYRGHW
jgi:hypothetical protein